MPFLPDWRSSLRDLFRLPFTLVSNLLLQISSVDLHTREASLFSQSSLNLTNPPVKLLLFRLHLQLVLLHILNRFTPQFLSYVSYTLSKRFKCFHTVITFINKRLTLKKLRKHPVHGARVLALALPMRVILPLKKYINKYAYSLTDSYVLTKIMKLGKRIPPPTERRKGVRCRPRSDGNLPLNPRL